MLSAQAIGAEGLRSDSPAGQTGHCVANGATPLRRFCDVQVLSRGNGPATHYTIRRNTASIYNENLIFNISIYRYVLPTQLSNVLSL